MIRSAYLLDSPLVSGAVKECSLTTLSNTISEHSSFEKECGACALFSLHRGRIIACRMKGACED
jgi:hypothetical protein